MKKALLLGESQDGGWRGPNTLTVSVKQGGGFRVLELHARSFSVVCMVFGENCSGFNDFGDLCLCV